MIVVDASIVVTALTASGEAGVAVRARLRSDTLAAPELIDLEVVSALRGLARAGRMSADQASAAVAQLRDLPVQRAAHAPLLARVWQLRDNLTAYDGAYVALAEALGLSLVTADARLSRAVGVRCDIELLT